MFGKISTIAAIAATLMIPSALFAQMTDPRLLATARDGASGTADGTPTAWVRAGLRHPSAMSGSAVNAA
jgi:hypothetical protein